MVPDFLYHHAATDALDTYEHVASIAILVGNLHALKVRLEFTTGTTGNFSTDAA